MFRSPSYGGRLKKCRWVFRRPRIHLPQNQTLWFVWVLERLFLYNIKRKINYNNFNILQIKNNIII
ncbi:hypothetical protein NEIELOOT_00169 [Neisseria elongata subsp. glycolytica ATCC 29315]|uniref:Uncharacterized protein n=1 Tax=Neisseria elongata subsp. glycolytica ATCC 29315 TaxID=546263 RepID=D4DMA4_NEIEG|nr:hypothetical protein NEIELOOT_00169 [Neisseria elongata subsp. glycolytica ATCC 29315]